MDLGGKIRKGDQRALAKAISIVEDRKHGYRSLLSRLYDENNKGQIIGVTGSPGAGKSSLVNMLVKEWRKRGKTVAIAAVDPTSPFSGGALLGDRVRMKDHEEDDGVFIRSLGTRGSLGGLSEACQDVVRLMSASGFDLVVVETVGVGQSELDIMKTADSVALVLYPSGGDVIQAFKAGIMEIADLFIINKADLPGVDQLKGELEDLLHISERFGKWSPPIVETISTENKGMNEVVEKLDEHFRFLVSSSERTERRLSQRKQEVTRRLQEQFLFEISPLLDRYFTHQEVLEQDPYETSEKIFQLWKKGEGTKRGEG
ncbi:methylmalonyl Co-A mutase-associated GTPase MeaB [Bacillus shivajii]|uniref:methylmalonyl Co-A mutase-associated GTPase MeaB n=1 Tax=Bacillus shivajii TaxID=1983719 RepID=UPI001CFA48E0|nr:methylmalonyl Co-A mutase-associated GTPase MeaB [Bacillus shivajii]UCZ53053.1 methylmalonyl Co-A mutase-associated GTPase MeaB [Bacillus shivajii]